MQFLIDNYIWFLIAGIVIVMTLIGYIAEKTDFGHKEIKKSENRNVKKEKAVKEVKQSKMKLNDVVYNDGPKEAIEVIDFDKASDNDSLNFVNPISIEEDLTVPLSGEKKEEINVLPSNGIEEDLTVPLNGNSVKNVEEIEETKKEEKNVVESEDIWKF